MQVISIKLCTIIIIPTFRHSEASWLPLQCGLRHPPMTHEVPSKFTFMSVVKTLRTTGGVTACTNVLWENQKFWPHLIWYIRHDHHGNAREALFWFEGGMVGSKIVRFSPNTWPNVATAMASIVCECCTTKGATVPVHVETASHLQRLEEPWSRKVTLWSSHLEHVSCVLGIWIMYSI